VFHKKTLTWNPYNEIREMLASYFERRKLASPGGFAEVVSRGRWKRARHLDLINDKLVEIAQGRLHRLVILLPPRHGKSELVSRYFPAWYLANNPNHRLRGSRGMTHLC
jgi:hypothetical protein